MIRNDNEAIEAPPNFAGDIAERFRSGYAGIPVDEEEYFTLWDEYDRLQAVGASGPWVKWIAGRIGAKAE